MKTFIEKLMAQVNKLDMWTQLAIFGGWQYMVNSACINTALRYVPDEPVDNGIEHYTQYEAARRRLIDEAETSNLPALITLQRDISNSIGELGGTARELEDTLQFRSGKVPDKKTFEREFEERRRQGMRPNIPRQAFIKQEYEAACKAHNALVAKGEDAIRLCDTVTINGLEGNLPEWLPESMEQKMLEKLHDRWDKLERSRTNTRLKKKQRDEAEADQRMVAALLAEYDETPGISADEAAAEDAKQDAWLIKAGDLNAPAPSNSIAGNQAQLLRLVQMFNPDGTIKTPRDVMPS